MAGIKLLSCPEVVVSIEFVNRLLMNLRIDLIVYNSVAKFSSRNKGVQNGPI